MEDNSLSHLGLDNRFVIHTVGTARDGQTLVSVLELYSEWEWGRRRSFDTACEFPIILLLGLRACAIGRSSCRYLLSLGLEWVLFILFWARCAFFQIMAAALQLMWRPQVHWGLLSPLFVIAFPIVAFVVRSGPFFFLTRFFRPWWSIFFRLEGLREFDGVSHKAIEALMQLIVRGRKVGLQTQTLRFRPYSVHTWNTAIFFLSFTIHDWPWRRSRDRYNA